MSFKDLKIKNSYNSGADNIIKDFYIPVLSKTVLYKRAVGYFSSSCLIAISNGIYELVKNNGKIQLVASPNLSQDDIKAIDAGYESRKIIEDALLREFKEPYNIFEEERLNLLAHLIENNTLDIKLAYLKKNNKIGMYHEKIGLMYDEDNNIVAFTGSLNETQNALSHNYESIDVFCSLNNDVLERVIEKEKHFDELWECKDSNLEVIDFPKVAKDKLNKYKKEKVDYFIEDPSIPIVPVKTENESENLDNTDLQDPIDDKLPNSNDIDIYKSSGFKTPVHIKFKPYQEEAINSWAENNYVGIFDMATGTGKTFTALGALSKLSETLNANLAVFIVCPLMNLVEQWVDDIKAFNVIPLVCYSKKPKWHDLLYSYILAFNEKKILNFCAIVCNNSFQSDFMQTQIQEIQGNICLVVDEAHNFGSEKMRKCLIDKFQYRLALSATIERYYDDVGTAALYEYFGKKCITYALDKAIDEGHLAPYEYYPILVSLTNEELNKYIEYTTAINSLQRKLRKIIVIDRDKQEEILKNLRIKCAKLLAGAENKIPALKNAIEDYVDDKYIVIFCGISKVNYADIMYDTNPDYIDNDNNICRQIDAVTDLLGNQLKMDIRQYTKDQTPEDRKIIKDGFSKGSPQAIVAIRCLDEGANIPELTTAFLLASSKNPKEYIQRSGRVLRKSKDKICAKIYDFIVLSRDIIDSIPHDIIDNTAEQILAKRELKRLNIFGKSCLNLYCYKKIDKLIREFYGISKGANNHNE
ncbi:MAG: DEAD/DEAH box helicase family protein [Christensenellaceae bacterium]|jgi:superfamily II DNA or RNA helicase|nr:DEAD/DEAH box helicase family protein [Christensenellaceae bacterium]